jgi:hypothetical protein
MSHPHSTPALTSGQQTRTPGILVAACLMILFGFAEVVTSFTHNFLGITTSGSSVFAVSSAAIGLCYVAAGVLILTLRKWAAVLAMILLAIDVLGRLELIATGLFPTSSPKNTFSIIAGTLIVGLFALYIGWRWKTFH